MTSLRTIPAIAALALVAAAPPAEAQAPEGPGLVTVSGMGVIHRAPDVASVVFVAESWNANPGVAQRDAWLRAQAAAAGVGRAVDRIVRIDGASFFGRLRAKMGWGGLAARDG